VVISLWRSTGLKELKAASNGQSGTDHDILFSQPTGRKKYRVMGQKGSGQKGPSSIKSIGRRRVSLGLDLIEPGPLSFLIFIFLILGRKLSAELRTATPVAHASKSTVYCQMGKTNSFTTEVIQCANDDVLNRILSFEQLVIKEIREPKEQFCNYIQDPRNLNMFLRNGGEPIGYILLVPHDRIVDELGGDDVLLAHDPERYYIDQLVVVASERKHSAFLCLIFSAFSIMNSRGIYKFSTHVLAAGGLDRIILRSFKKTLTVPPRRVKLATYNNVSFVYLEGEYRGEHFIDNTNA
jgi:hypothetical protein